MLRLYSYSITSLLLRVLGRKYLRGYLSWMLLKIILLTILGRRGNMCDMYKCEAEPAFNFSTAAQEADRCLLCHDAPCTKACPAGTNPAKFIRSVRFRNFKGAAETVRENNALGSICARVCPTEKYCEMACSRTGIDKPINIGGLQRFVTDYEEAMGMEILHAGEPNGKKVALIGAGPANLTCATELLKLGYAVELFEEKAEAGGYLTYGIPEYRLPQEVVRTEIKRIEDLGAVFHLNTMVDDLKLQDLKKNFDAVVVANGFSAAKVLPMFIDNEFTETAVDFLARVKVAEGNVEVPNNVIVIGGGDVAMDTATTLKKLGCKNVTDVIYEKSCEFVASKKELAGTREAGVTMIDGYVPESVDGHTVVFKHRELDNTLTLSADLIILAVGQVNRDSFGLELNKNEVAFEGYHVEGTNCFVAGDIAQGDKTVVAAVKKGKEAACAVDEYLGSEN